jgi:hypothetical protein
VLEGRVIIANDVTRHPKYRGLPQGHPAIGGSLYLPLLRLSGAAGPVRPGLGVARLVRYGGAG